MPLKTRTFARQTLPLCVGTLHALVEHLEQHPETRHTIVEAVCLSLALVDFQSCYLGLGGWHGACKAARQRLADMVGVVQDHCGAPEVSSLDRAAPAVLGSRGPADPEAALRLAHHLTEYVAFDPRREDLTPNRYCRLIVEVMALFAAVVVHALMGSALTPESERGLEHYQLALWEAYRRLYGNEETSPSCQNDPD